MPRPQNTPEHTPEDTPDVALADLQARLDWCEREAAAAMAQGRVERVRQLRQTALAVEQEWQQRRLRQRLAGVSAPDAPAVPGPALNPEAVDPPDGVDLLRRIQGHLAETEAFVLYHLDGLQAWAVVVRRGTARVVTLEAERLAHRLEGLHFQLDALRYPAARQGPQLAALVARSRGHLQALHAMLWAPLQTHLTGCTTCTVVPHGPLHRLPFAALHDGQGWLMERHALVLAAAPGQWLGLPRWRWPMQARVALLGAGEGPGNPAAALPHVAAELDAIRAVLQGRASLSEDRAVRRDALPAAVARAQVVHLACHGAFRGDNPDFSHLLLTDGPFTLEALAGLRLHDALVVLSSCESGARAAAPGDEVMGLVRGLWRAGARHAVSSLWAVDDEATAALMGAFHAALVEGQSPAAALARAQQHTAARWPHPFHWAAFTVHGRD
jgi:CHAT domain-containing protein